MAPTTTTTPTAAQAGQKLKPKPKRQQTFLELYNSSSTGHQVSNGVSKPTSWYKSRQSKLNQQFRNSTLPLSLLASNPPSLSDTPQNTSVPSSSSFAATTTSAPPPSKPAKSIFSACSIYISGTTAPLISDHTLKHLLVYHGAHVSALLRRSTTTHVILTTVGKVGSGAGGGLAAGKLQKEIDSRKVSTIKYVSVQWVLDSIKAGKKLSEAKYTNVAVGRSAGQGTLMAFVGKENVGK
ncbi:hypothetical protein BDD12DRAFT_562449 [Trichophaea hybrida]|nr:hypothetical protein BDD12DRAFT_562449 [Trichophaea hybrida]